MARRQWIASVTRFTRTSAAGVHVLTGHESRKSRPKLRVLQERIDCDVNVFLVTTNFCHDPDHELYEDVSGIYDDPDRCILPNVADRTNFLHQIYLVNDGDEKNSMENLPRRNNRCSHWAKLVKITENDCNMNARNCTGEYQFGRVGEYRVPIKHDYAKLIRHNHLLEPEGYSIAIAESVAEKNEDIRHGYFSPAQHFIGQTHTTEFIAEEEHLQETNCRKQIIDTEHSNVYQDCSARYHTYSHVGSISSRITSFDNTLVWIICEYVILATVLGKLRVYLTDNIMCMSVRLQLKS